MRFTKNRALRILPGLACALVVTALVVGTAFATISVSAYLGNRAVWGYIVLGVCLVPHWVLPTVFATNPIAGANGSLWTLPVEVRAYALVALFGLAGLVRGRTVAPL